MTRLKRYDYAKGLAILLMVFAHTAPGDIVVTWIFSFHMPLFFFTGGAMLQKKYGDKTIDPVQLKGFFTKRVRQLGVPYLIFCLMLTAFYSALELISGQTIQLGGRLLRIITMQGIDSLWFLPVFFCAELLMMVFQRSKYHQRFAWVASGAAVLCVWGLSVFPLNNRAVMFAAKTLIAVFFMQIGFVVEQKELYKKVNVITAVGMLLLGAVLSHVNGFAAIGSLEVGRFWPLYLINPIISCVSILTIFHQVETNQKSNLRFLDFFGRNTIVVLCTNNLLIECFRLLDHRVTGDALLRLGFLGCIIFTAILIILEIPLIRLANGPVAVLFGKQRGMKN